jgi:hypothetical protein
MKSEIVAPPSVSTTLTEAFSAPFNWCDRHCERCLLAPDCPVHCVSEQQRYAHEMRGENADEVHIAIRDIAGDIVNALEMLRTAASEEAFELSTPLPQPPIVLDQVRLHNAGLELTAAVRALAPSPVSANESPVVEVAMAAAIILTTKVARIGAYLTIPESDAWEIDAVPNLLLIERVRSQLTDALLRLDDEGFDPSSLAKTRKTLGEINRILDPLIAKVGNEPRALMEALTARSAAPSPFCTSSREPTE